jgi:hypothetical protein
MKKNFLKRINLLLGSISVALAGCHVQKQPAEPTPTPSPDTPVVEQPNDQEPIMCLYGAPPEFYERPMRKYGVPDAAE